MIHGLTRKGFLTSLGSLLFYAPWRGAPAEATATTALPRDARTAARKRYILNRCFVAGLRYYRGVTLVAEGGVKPGDALRLIAQPENPHDEFAVEIYHAASGVKLGYVPRTENAHLSRLLTQGAVLEARVAQVNSEADTWEAIEVEIWLAG